MVGMLGINVYRVFMLVFGIGAMAAGFAGIVNAPVVSLTPDMGESILVQTFVVVVIGGVGLVSRRDPRRADRRGNPQPDLDGGPELLRGHAVRGDDLGAAAAAAGPARPAGPRVSATADAADRRLLVRGADGARPDRRAVRAALSRLRARHGQPDPGLGPVRHRLRYPVRLYRPACRSASRRSTAPAASSPPTC